MIVILSVIDVVVDVDVVVVVVVVDVGWWLVVAVIVYRPGRSRLTASTSSENRLGALLRTSLCLHCSSATRCNRGSSSPPRSPSHFGEDRASR